MTVLLERENTLSEIGITTAESQRLQKLMPQERERELAQQIASYTKEVLEDTPVSTPYSYWFGPDNQLYSNSSFKEIYKIERQFDPQERGGKPLTGFYKLTECLRRNPNKIIFWYSPPGPASYDENLKNPYSKINYTDGQLYVQYFDTTAGKINAVAVKTTNEDAIHQFMPEAFRLVDFTKYTPEERINYFLTNPHISNYTIDSFLNQDWENSTIYTDKARKDHSVGDVMLQIRDSLLGIGPKFTLSGDIVRSLAEEAITEDTILHAYISTIKKYMIEKGVETMSLSGSCGGGTVDLEGLNGLLSTPSLPVPQDIISLYSSTYRALTQVGSSEHYDDYQCPHCGETLSGEKKNDPSSWRKNCDNCHKELNCTKAA